jgi:hypothetical protein
MEQSKNTEEELPTESSTSNMKGREPRKWKSYLLEFLMIFLAISLGFFADELRESKNESVIEREMAEVLYHELVSDSIQASGILKLRLKREDDLDYLIAFFRDSSLANTPKRFYPTFTKGLYMFNSFTFEPKDGILNQLRNSGSSQYFENITFQKLLSDLNVDVNSLRSRAEQDYQFFSDPIKPFLLKHYDFKWLDNLLAQDPQKSLFSVINDYEAAGKTIPARILNGSSLDRTEAVNLILFYKSLLRVSNTRQLKNYIDTNGNLLQFLRSNYSIEAKE